MWLLPLCLAGNCLEDFLILGLFTLLQSLFALLIQLESEPGEVVMDGL